MNNITALFIKFAWILICSILLVISGCATIEPPTEQQETVFYPEPPELPRLQFLRSFTGSYDIEKEITAFDSFVTGAKKVGRRIDKPYGVEVYDGSIYVADTNESVMLFDLKNKQFRRMEGAKGLGKLLQPINIDIDKDGNKYVADPVRGQVVGYDKNDFYVKAFGSIKKWKPVDAHVFEDLLYVADRENREIKVFDIKSGTQIDSIGRKGEPHERLGLPTNIAFNKEGTLYVMDAGRMQIIKYDRDGHYLGKIGQSGRNPGQFSRPRGIAIDREGRVYAVDAAFSNVQIFHKNDRLLLVLGGPGKTPGSLTLPADVTIDYDNVEYFKKYADPNFEIEYLVIVTSQTFGELPPVNVYGFGKEKGRQYKTDEELLKDQEKELKESEEETN